MNALAAAAPAADLHTPEWHVARQSGVGGSDIPILAGISPYSLGPHDLYQRKLGLVEPDEPSDAMEVGSVIEDAIATLYARRTGRTVIRSNVLARHPVHQFAIGNIDRKVKGERRLVEIKNRRALSKAEGLPADIECQVQWYLGVTRYPIADVAILVGGNDLRIVEVKADAAYFDDLLVIAGDFWKHVETWTPPEIDGSESAARYLASIYPWHRRDADLLPADATFEALAAELRDARVESVEALGRVGNAENAIKALLGDAPGVVGNGWRITWKRSADYERTNWKDAVAAYVNADRSRMVEMDPFVKEHTALVEGSRRFVPTFDADGVA